MLMQAVSESPTIEALSALVNLGASDTLLGLAVRELVTARKMGAGPYLLSTGSGMALVDAGLPSAPASTQVKSPAPGAAVPLKTASPGQVPPVASKPEIVVFKNAQGARSSVSIAPADWAALVKAYAGDEKSVRAKARALAGLAPEGTNRSKWTLSELLRRRTGSPG